MRRTGFEPAQALSHSLSYFSIHRRQQKDAAFRIERRLNVKENFNLMRVEVVKIPMEFLALGSLQT